MENNFENPLAPESDVTQTPQQAAQKKGFTESVKGFSAKLDLEGKSKKLMEGGNNLWSKMKSWSKKTWITIGAVAAVLVVGLVLWAILSNTYKTPVNIMQKQANATSYKTDFELLKQQLNGFASSEMNSIIKIYKKSDDYKDNIDDAKEEFKEDLADMKDEYGSNFKYKYKIEDKEKLDKDDRKDLQEYVRDIAKELAEEIDDFIDDADSDDWEDLADEMGISKSQAKDLAKTCLKIAKKLKSVKISAGYELDVKVTLSGKELDEPEEHDTTVTVIKVNGRWMRESALTSLLSMAGYLVG